MGVDPRDSLSAQLLRGVSDNICKPDEEDLDEEVNPMVIPLELLLIWPTSVTMATSWSSASGL